MARAPIVHKARDPKSNRNIVIRKDNEWEEYIVQFFDDGEYLSLSDYHTSHWEDAHATAMLFLKVGA